MKKLLLVLFLAVPAYAESPYQENEVLNCCHGESYESVHWMIFVGEDGKDYLAAKDSTGNYKIKVKCSESSRDSHNRINWIWDNHGNDPVNLCKSGITTKKETEQKVTDGKPERLTDEMYDAMWEEMSNWYMDMAIRATNPDGQRNNLWKNRKPGDEYGRHWSKLSPRSRAAWWEYFATKLDYNYFIQAAKEYRIKDEQLRKQAVDNWNVGTGY